MTSLDPAVAKKLGAFKIISWSPAVSLTICPINPIKAPEDPVFNASANLPSQTLPYLFYSSIQFKNCLNDRLSVDARRISSRISAAA
jgi:hypothetical protein